jgi:hypothetical protein
VKARREALRLPVDTIGRVRAFTKKTTGGGATQTWSAPRLRFTKDASFLIAGFFRPGCEACPPLRPAQPFIVRLFSRTQSELLSLKKLPEKRTKDR